MSLEYSVGYSILNKASLVEILVIVLGVIGILSNKYNFDILYNEKKFKSIYENYFF